ncbi:hypothetical protein PHYBLDRAFT_71489 [Phycomyces blakesleeanus NRRL 1555(-)]|uniref:Uncharacterized protein n=1 Tax=Phycomyces blakesleeanus (strain ATCC 8743b / DSM 1359 / FGSC 10004 / NBRC 33097 / NRRL 1555) TaxID=763407 RepID=A0A162U860_PHYB8|nr:hypothetical protein PHYBLDRAFT_71489 [Phycomyces blakesleeanus NRRL 1555(-)]OAD74242.1 hypothetical protein PHYBLDRAFT_71489 [Phycomyces blakesleeanus NRRL 1555(-)]|eukprot:XP_018292282.1 hypothetical protein PHYBLDRAFT_71489 [Phycomyces blakesleeanus NRRL 1555(-)]
MGSVKGRDTLIKRDGYTELDNNKRLNRNNDIKMVTIIRNKNSNPSNIMIYKLQLSEVRALQPNSGSLLANEPGELTVSGTVTYQTHTHVHYTLRGFTAVCVNSPNM